LFSVCFHGFDPDEEVGKPQIYDHVSELQAEDEHLQYFGNLKLDGDQRKEGMSNRMKLGKLLGNFNKRILGGICMEINTDSSKSERWRITFAKIGVPSGQRGLGL
jgi:hypothetical protein